VTHLELTDHCSLHYRVDGHPGGCPLLLFNGVSLPLDIWGSLATRLAADRQVIRFDQRNAGATSASGTLTLLDVVLIHVGTCVGVGDMCVSLLNMANLLEQLQHSASILICRLRAGPELRAMPMLVFRFAHQTAPPLT
jgi:pimeloyl-ACP methyl ester carboxylesterase